MTVTLVKTRVIISAVCRPKFTKFRRSQGSLRIYRNFSICQYFVSFRRYQCLNRDVFLKPPALIRSFGLHILRCFWAPVLKGRKVKVSQILDVPFQTWFASEQSLVWLVSCGDLRGHHHHHVACPELDVAVRTSLLHACRFCARW